LQRGSNVTVDVDNVVVVNVVVVPLIGGDTVMVLFPNTLTSHREPVKLGKHLKKYKIKKKIHLKKFNYKNKIRYWQP
jgi:hypothetical protein